MSRWRQMPREALSIWASSFLNVLTHGLPWLLLPLSIFILIYPLNPGTSVSSGAATFTFLTLFSYVILTAGRIIRNRRILYFIYLGINTLAFVLASAGVDFALSLSDNTCFNEPIATRVDALYFAVTNLSSGGPGSIVPLTQQCKLALTVQTAVGYILTTVIVAAAVGMLIERLTVARRDIEL